MPWKLPKLTCADGIRDGRLTALDHLINKIGGEMCIGPVKTGGDKMCSLMQEHKLQQKVYNFARCIMKRFSLFFQKQKVNIFKDFRRFP